MSSILPKGIVVNTEEISDDIRPKDGKPLSVDEIARMWKVYTTTHRRLLDPTAKRLENYWWRVWGSRNMTLDGNDVARLFLDISFGPTFVPLRGPPNRDESGGSPQNIALRPGTGVTSLAQLHRNHETDSSSGRQSSNVSREQSYMPPPILKKSGGPSTVGPRPTARFVSPHNSEDDVTLLLPGQNRSSLVKTLQPTPATKETPDDSSGFVPSDDMIESLREPHIPVPRMVGQRSVSPELVAAEASQDTKSDPKSLNEIPGKVRQHSSEDLIAPTKVQNQSRFHENFSPSPGKRAEKASFKKPKSTKPRTPKTFQSQNSIPNSTSEIGPKGRKLQASRQEAGPSVGKQSNPNTQDVIIDKNEMDEDDLKELELQKTLILESSAALTASKNRNQPVSRSGNNYQEEEEQRKLTLRKTKDLGQRLRISGCEQNSSQASLAEMGSFSLGPTSLTNDSDWEEEDLSDKDMGKGKKKAGESKEELDLFAKRPIQPVSGVTVLANPSNSINPIGRSKSQLTLLLEEDRAKESNKKSESKEGRSK